MRDGWAARRINISLGCNAVIAVSTSAGVIRSCQEDRPTAHQATLRVRHGLFHVDIQVGVAGEVDEDRLYGQEIFFCAKNALV